MYVCLCKGIKDSDIRDAVSNGADSLAAVQDQLGVATQCGKCTCLAHEIISDALGSSGTSSSYNSVYYNVA
ncbi:bacterioferritin-associated ferredoxin [Teredinibacter haidensis]|uniref:bacterioferritin-associated ferredoxin n=1 Tax=Teredinibacter haidensis TaxID=2731755 RepID=UPI0009489CCE|nr:bacterioferritin-associated ferredoxin [Teredinibacter haidensis]